MLRKATARLEDMTIEWADEEKKAARKRRRTMAQSLTSSPTKIWRSRISWRIALSVFLTILAVQVGILTLTVQQQEFEILDRLREIGRSAVAPVIEDRVTHFLENPIKPEKAERVVTTTIVSGMAIYSADLTLLGTYGAPVSLILPNHDALSKTIRSDGGQSYEVVYRANDLRRPYIIVAKLDARNVADEIFASVKQAVIILFLLSLFVTTVLMITLSRWLLEPMLFLRENLLSASENPENPEIRESPFDSNDEIGGAIELSQTLIKQNADNIRQIKTAAEDKIHKLAYYDTLTGLPNRTLFLQQLGEQARKAAAGGEDAAMHRFAVVALDLDHFKDVNDSMGHNIGDAILRGVGKRLRAALPDSAVVARSGEDEFAITVPLSTDINTARDIGEKVKKVVSAEPFKVFNEEFQIRASIGVATFPDDSADPDQVLKNADIALNRAKEEGRDTVKEYSEDFDRAVQARFQMLRDLRDAMENKELSLYYQPQFDLKTGKVIGAEALLRWFKKDDSKDGGKFISPAEFVPIAEQSGLIVPIGEWVLRVGCETAARWQKAGHNMRIAVNVSGAQFYQSDIVEYVSRVLKDTGLKPHNLELEVTESVFMDDVHHTIDTLQKLHSLGVELAIDDFGTGYSSLSYLRLFPIDRLKIDQSFIRNALNDNNDASIARTIVRLGHSLNLKVIAEGVETKEHEKFLMEEECDEVQGFRYSKPIPTEKLDEFLAAYNNSGLSYFDK